MKDAGEVAVTFTSLFCRLLVVVPQGVAHVIVQHICVINTVDGDEEVAMAIFESVRHVAAGVGLLLGALLSKIAHYKGLDTAFALLYVQCWYTNLFSLMSPLLLPCSNDGRNFVRLPSEPLEEKQQDETESTDSLGPE